MALSGGGVASFSSLALASATGAGALSAGGLSGARAARHRLACAATETLRGIFTRIISGARHISSLFVSGAALLTSWIKHHIGKSGDVVAAAGACSQHIAAYALIWRAWVGMGDMAPLAS